MRKIDVGMFMLPQVGPIEIWTSNMVATYPICTLKLTFDVAISSHSTMAGMDVVCRDSKDPLVDGVAFKQVVVSVLMVETLASRAVVGMAASNGMRKVVFESDNKFLLSRW
ncbi:hypothetical protein SLE2022_295130 [Rubroshorea leprosula]